mmetsp:Transcript_51575/g.145377  ORF Transcript_51575/g.145377 Transcript_51575/m.145377 type:complete len:152 (-) Transcript_51575:103-558(-)
MPSAKVRPQPRDLSPKPSGRPACGSDPARTTDDIESYRMSELAALNGKLRTTFVGWPSERSASSASSRATSCSGATRRGSDSAVQYIRATLLGTRRRRVADIELADDVLYPDRVCVLPPVAKSFCTIVPSTYSKSTHRARLPQFRTGRQTA